MKKDCRTCEHGVYSKPVKPHKQIPRLDEDGNPTAKQVWCGWTRSEPWPKVLLPHHLSMHIIKGRLREWDKQFVWNGCDAWTPSQRLGPKARAALGVSWSPYLTLIDSLRKYGIIA